MNRADLAWCLDATLPHVGSVKGKCLHIVTIGGQLHCSASDDLTAGIARIPDGPQGWDFYMSKSEAQDLMRFVRPTRKAHHEEVLSHRLVDGELHVGIEDDSAVFETAVPDALDQNFTTGKLLDLLSLTMQKTAPTDHYVQGAGLASRFGKAQRYEDDRMHWFPRQSELHRIAVVTVGHNFLGMIAGMADDLSGHTWQTFLQNAEGVAA